MNGDQIIRLFDAVTSPKYNAMATDVGRRVGEIAEGALIDQAAFALMPAASDLVRTLSWGRRHVGQWFRKSFSRDQEPEYGGRRRGGDTLDKIDVDYLFQIAQIAITFDAELVGVDGAPLQTHW